MPERLRVSHSAPEAQLGEEVRGTEYSDEDQENDVAGELGALPLPHLPSNSAAAAQVALARCGWRRRDGWTNMLVEVVTDHDLAALVLKDLVALRLGQLHGQQSVQAASSSLPDPPLRARLTSLRDPRVLLTCLSMACTLSWISCISLLMSSSEVISLAQASVALRMSAPPVSRMSVVAWKSLRDRFEPQRGTTASSSRLPTHRILVLINDTSAGFKDSGSYPLASPSAT